MARFPNVSLRPIGCGQCAIWISCGVSVPRKAPGRTFSVTNGLRIGEAKPHKRLERRPSASLLKISLNADRARSRRSALAASILASNMQALKTWSYWRPISVGAVSGTLLGAVVYMAMWLRTNSENQALRGVQKSGGDIMHVTLAVEWWSFPLVGLLAVTLGCCLFQRFFRDRKAR